MIRNTAVVIALAAGLIGMTGCTTDTTPAAPTASAPAVTQATQSEEAATDPNAIPEPVIANPVTIIKKIDGITLDNPDATVGEWDFDGNKYVSGNYMNNAGGLGTEVTVWTFDPSWPLPEALPLPDDTTDIITGEGFAVVVSGATMYDTKVDVQELAEKLDGEVMEK